MSARTERIEALRVREGDPAARMPRPLIATRLIEDGFYSETEPPPSRPVVVALTLLALLAALAGLAVAVVWWHPWT